jgi:hypothetical protein
MKEIWLGYIKQCNSGVELLKFWMKLLSTFWELHFDYNPYEQRQSKQTIKQWFITVFWESHIHTHTYKQNESCEFISCAEKFKFKFKLLNEAYATDKRMKGGAKPRKVVNKRSQ